MNAPHDLRPGAAGFQPTAVPRLGFRPVGTRIERVLLLVGYDASEGGPQAAAAAAWQEASVFAVTVCNAEPGGRRVPSLPDKAALQDFDAILVVAGPATLPIARKWRRGFDGPVLLAAADRLAEPGLVSIGPEPGSWDAAVDGALRAAGKLRTAGLQAPRAGHNVLVLVPHKPKQDPRIGWLARGAPAPLVGHQIGMHAATEGGAVTTIDPTGGLVQSVPMETYAPDEAVSWAAWCAGHPGAEAGIERLLWIERALALPPEAFRRLLGAWGNDERDNAMRWLLRYVLSVCATTVRHGLGFRGVDAIVAADLPILPAAYILGALFRVPVIFDAHEYWPEADLGSADFEIGFWEDMERRLLRHADLRVTVSTGLARRMERQYGTPFMVVPNAEPLASRLEEAAPAPPAPTCQFLFQGVFAPGRGLELLIAAWPRTAPEAHLVLRGPPWEFSDKLKAQAAATGLLDRRIFFPPPVEETDLIASAARSHVGLVPYEPHGENHRHCCPNKMSQNMAAGLPILANDTAFVREVVAGSGAGLVVDFRDQDALVAAVDRLARDPGLREEYAQRARRHFTERFHWEVLSRDLYQQLLQRTAMRPLHALQFFGDLPPLGDNSAAAPEQGAPVPDAAAEAGRAAAVAPPVAAPAPVRAVVPGPRLVDRVWRRLPEPARRVIRRPVRLLRRLRGG